MDKTYIVFLYCGNIPVWEPPPGKVQCQHWWPPESDIPCQPWCWTKSRKPPSECCSCGGATERGTWKGHQRWSPPGSVHPCQWRCYRLSAAKGSVERKKENYIHTNPPIASLYKSTTFHQLTTMESSPDPNSFTSWGTTPVCTTTSILSLGPSVRYEMAQQVSASTSLSSWCRRRISVGSICFTASSGGAGFLLRHRFDRVQVTFLR